MLSEKLHKSYENNYNDVKLFHEVFGHPVNNNPQINIFEEKPKLVDFRISLIEEEVNEFIEAFQKNDFIECVDAICDILYVVNGAYLVLGTSYITENVSIVPPLFPTANFVKPNLKIFFESFDVCGTVKSYILVLKEHINSLKMNNKNENFDEFVHTLHKIVVDCYSLSSFFGINVDNCFEEVQKSNMSKVCLSEEEAIETVNWYKENETKYKCPSYRKSNNQNYWIIFDENTSKILKSINFKLPNLDNITNFSITLSDRINDVRNELNYLEKLMVNAH